VLALLAPPVIVAVIIVAAWHAGAVWGLLAGAGCAGAYAASLKLLPLRRCWWCKGSKLREDSRFWRGSVGSCWVCRGSGKRTRLGVRLFMRSTHRAIRAGQHGRNY
jgi:hypothetical protein